MVKGLFCLYATVKDVISGIELEEPDIYASCVLEMMVYKSALGNVCIHKYCATTCLIIRIA